jgi:membrane protease YdiL (CAAX protease family)
MQLRPAVLVPPQWRGRWRRYAREARRPLQSLLFLIPLMLVYEVGTRWGATGRRPAGDLLAYSVIENLLGWFGLVGSWLPPAVLVLSLLVWQHRRRERWRVRWSILPAMLVESLALAIPLLALSALFEAPPRAQWLNAIGAGLYEELVFRLLLFSGLTWLLVEVFRMGRDTAPWLAVALAVLAFALCHFEPLGAEYLSWKPFWFKAVAGLYLSVLFLERGLGICSGCHVAYNLLLVWLHR